jgi:hypothetical protein
MPRANHELNRVIFKRLGEEKGMAELYEAFGNFRISYGGIMETNRKDNIRHHYRTKTMKETAKNSNCSYSTAYRHTKMLFHLWHMWKFLWLNVAPAFLKQAQQWFS